MLVEKKRRKIVKNPIRQIGTDIQLSPTAIVISIANALGLKIRYDRDENGKVIGVSAYAGDCLRLADHCTYMQTWVDAGTWNSPYRNDIVICDNPSEQYAKTQVQSGYDFTISEFIYGTENMTVEQVRMIAYDIKQALIVGQYPNNVRGEKRILTSTHDADDNPQSTQDATKQNITNNQQDTNMKTENRKRNVVRLNEAQLKQMIAESVKNVLNEKYNVTNMTKGDWDERDATINTVTDFGEDEDYSEIQKWGGTFVDAITSVDKHLKLAKTNIENLFNGNNEEKNGFYNDNDNESDYQYINHVEKCIDNARSTLLRLRNRRMMYRGLN